MDVLGIMGDASRMSALGNTSLSRALGATFGPREGTFGNDLRALALPSSVNNGYESTTPDVREA